MTSWILSNEPLVRLGTSFGILAVMAGWEIVAERRQLSQANPLQGGLRCGDARQKSTAGSRNARRALAVAHLAMRSEVELPQHAIGPRHTARRQLDHGRAAA